MNLNKLAQRVSEREGKKVQVNIAQIKEVIRCTLEVAAEDLYYLTCMVMESTAKAQTLKLTRIRPPQEKKKRGKK